MSECAGDGSRRLKKTGEDLLHCRDPTRRLGGHHAIHDMPLRMPPMRQKGHEPETGLPGSGNLGTNTRVRITDNFAYRMPHGMNASKMGCNLGAQSKPSWWRCNALASCTSTRPRSNSTARSHGVSFPRSPDWQGLVRDPAEQWARRARRGVARIQENDRLRRVEIVQLVAAPAPLGLHPV